MKVRNLAVVAFAVLMSVFAATGMGAAVSATEDGGGTTTVVECPAGSLRDGDLIKPNTETSSLADCNIPRSATQTNLMTKARDIINAVVAALGVVAVAVMVLGGITFIMSQGDAAKVTKAKNTILYGLIGLVIALLAFAIVNFVLKSVG